MNGGSRKYRRLCSGTGKNEGGRMGVVSSMVASMHIRII